MPGPFIRLIQRALRSGRLMFQSDGMKKLRKRSGTGSVARFITATQLADFAARLSGIGRTANIEWLRERGRAGIVEHRRHARNAKRFAE